MVAWVWWQSDGEDGFRFASSLLYVAHTAVSTRYHHQPLTRKKGEVAATGLRKEDLEWEEGGGKSLKPASCLQAEPHCSIHTYIPRGSW